MPPTDTIAKYVAMHEAAHVLYSAEMGVRQWIVHGEGLIRGRKVRAAIRPFPVEPYTKPGIAAMARYYACGDVAAQILASAPVTDDEGDIEGFIEDVKPRMPNVTPAVIGHWWKKAKREIKRDFASLEVRTLMQALADRIEPKIEEANKHPQTFVQCTIAELVEVPRLLQLLDRKT